MCVCKSLNAQIGIFPIWDPSASFYTSTAFADNKAIEILITFHASNFIVPKQGSDSQLWHIKGEGTIKMLCTVLDIHL